MADIYNEEWCVMVVDDSGWKNRYAYPLNYLMDPTIERRKEWPIRRIVIYPYSARRWWTENEDAWMIGL